MTLDELKGLIKTEALDLVRAAQADQQKAIADAAKNGDPNADRFKMLLTGEYANEQKKEAAKADATARELIDRGVGMKEARILRAAALAKSAGINAEQGIPRIIADVYKDKPLADAILKGGLIHKATADMTITDPVAGGFLVGEVWDTGNFIQLLRAMAVAGKLGATTYPMEGVTVHIPRLDAATSAYWLGEDKPMTAAKPSVGQVSLREKYLTGLVPISNQLLRSSSPAADGVVRDDLIKVLKLALDSAVFSGTGSAFQPLGIANYKSVQTNSQNARVDADFPLALLALLWIANIPMLRPGFAFNAFVERDFANVRTTTGQYLFRDEMFAKGTILGVPYGRANQITNGTDTNKKTTVFCGDFSELFIGERGNLMIDTSDQAAYTDNGSLKSAYENNVTLVRSFYICDVALRHDASFVVDNTVWTTG